MKSGKLVARTLRQNFHAAVVIVADPACNTEQVGFAFHEPAKADALYASANEKSTSLNPIFQG